MPTNDDFGLDPDNYDNHLEIDDQNDNNDNGDSYYEDPDDLTDNDDNDDGTGEPKDKDSNKSNPKQNPKSATTKSNDSQNKSKVFDDGSDNDDDDSDDSDDEEGTNLELNLVEGFDETLVSHVENSLQAGLLELTDEEITKTFDGTKESYDKLIQMDYQKRNGRIANAIVNNLPPKGRDFIQYLINGGQDINGFLELEKADSDWSEYNPEEISDEEAKQIILKDQIAKGMPKNKAERYVKSFEDNEVMDEAKEILDARTKGLKEQKESAIKQAKIDQQRTTQFQEKLHSDFKGQITKSNIAKEKQQEIYNAVYTKDDKGVSPLIRTIQKAMQNPNHLLQLAIMLDGYDQKKGFKMKAAKDSVKNEVNNQIKREIKRNVRNVQSSAEGKDANDGYGV